MKVLRITTITALKVILSLAAIYAIAVAVLWAVQDRLLFPTNLVGQVGTPAPPDAPRLTLTAPDGAELRGVRLVPLSSPMVDRVIVLGFGGNAWNAEDVAVYLQGLFPQSEIVAFHYRGYRPSTGRASVKALLADAPLIYDQVRESDQDARIVAVGLSIGSGVAVHLARDRKLDGLILVTPFDSLATLAADHFPWLPAAKLIHHPMPNADVLRGLDVPTAIIAAEHDEIIPRLRTSEMRGAARRLVYSRTIPDADHNDIYERQAFANTMRDALSAIEAAWH